MRLITLIPQGISGNFIVFYHPHSTRFKINYATIDKLNMYFYQIIFINFVKCLSSLLVAQNLATLEGRWKALSFSKMKFTLDFNADYIRYLPESKFANVLSTTTNVSFALRHIMPICINAFETDSSLEIFRNGTIKTIGSYHVKKKGNKNS